MYLEKLRQKRNARQTILTKERRDKRKDYKSQSNKELRNFQLWNATLLLDSKNQISTRYISFHNPYLRNAFPNAARNRDSTAICRMPLFVHRLNPISSEILAKRQRPLRDGTSVILVVKFRLGELESLWTSKSFIFHVSSNDLRIPCG